MTPEESDDLILTCYMSQDFQELHRHLLQRNWRWTWK